MSEPDFDAVIAAAEAIATEWLITEGKKELPPTWMLFHADGLAETVITIWDGPIGKKVAQAQIRDRLKDPDIVAFAHICEAWISMLDTDAATAAEVMRTGRSAAPQPSEDPKRKEVVVAIVSTPTERAQCVWEMVRDWKHRVAMLRRLVVGTGQREPIDSATLGGTVPNMFREAGR
jgi:hypothetical protein